MAENMTEFNDLPENVQDFIKSVVKKVRYRKKVRTDVFEELVTHFVDELADIADAEQRQQVAEEIIAGFGEPEVLAKLIKRGKKRCRPLWKKVLIAGFQITCILILLVGLQVSTFYIGKPVIKTNYAKWLTEKASAGKDPNLNARSDIDRAIELADFDFNKFDKILRMWPGDMNETQLQQAKKYLVDNADVIKALREAANKPYFWIDYDNPQFAEVSLNEAIFPDESEASNGLLMQMLSNWRKLALMMVLNVKYEVYNGQITQAINDYFVIQKIAAFFHGQGFLVEQLVGIAIEAVSYRAIRDILIRAEISQSQLLNIQEYLEKIVKKDRQTIDLTGEKALWLDEIQRGFTDDGKGDGRVLAKGLRFIFENKSNYLKGFVLGSYPGKKETTDEVERFFNQAGRFFEQTPFQADQKQLKITSSLSVFRSLDGVYERLTTLSWRFRADGLALVTVIAIKRYQKEKQQLPASLQQLVELGYLDELPMDPFSDGPLIYKTTEDDFVLYSVGADFEDDGGKIEYHDNGNVKQFRVEGGDYIFWPTRKKAE